MPLLFNKSKARNAEGVYIGRPSKWGNPFVIGKNLDRSQAVAKFEEWIRTQPELMAAAKRELKGQNLICWCVPFACHGHALMLIANEEN